MVTLRSLYDCCCVFVEEPVELTSALQDVKVDRLHDVAEFRLKVSKADCKVTWLHGTTPVTEGTKYTVGMDDLEPYLKINDVTGKDEGPFTVKVDDLTSTANLLVQGEFDSQTCTANQHQSNNQFNSHHCTRLVLISCLHIMALLFNKQM